MEEIMKEECPINGAWKEVMEVMEFPNEWNKLNGMKFFWNGMDFHGMERMCMYVSMFYKVDQ